MEHKEVKRGEVFYADLSPVVGSEQGGVRPVLIVQNDVGNRYSPTVIDADRKGLSPYDCSPEALDEIRAIKAAIVVKDERDTGLRQDRKSVV